MIAGVPIRADAAALIVADNADAHVLADMGGGTGSETRRGILHARDDD